MIRSKNGIQVQSFNGDEYHKSFCIVNKYQIIGKLRNISFYLLNCSKKPRLFACIYPEKNASMLEQLSHSSS